jgi:hypothetical protein
MIQLAAALKQMEHGSEPFHICFVTHNKSQQTGGKIIELTKAVKVGAKYNLKQNDMISVKQLDNSNHPYPVHIHLITQFNNKKVFY